MPDNLILLGFLGSLLAGFMTTIGVMLVLFGTMPSERTRDTLLGFQQFCERVIDCFGDVQEATVSLSRNIRNLP